MPFQIHYDNVVIDTLHNYFPAMLYEPEAFQTLPDVFDYASRQMRRHFDLFAAGRAAYRPLQPAPRVAVNPQLVNLADNLINAVRPGNFTNMMPGMNAQDILLAFMGARQAPAAAFEDPVIVRPTAEQIATATTIETLANDEVCAICQDTIAATTEARTINACDHQFHTGCIDTWFQQNVRCPVCRHDIRD
jgi:hypothetical protein